MTDTFISKRRKRMLDWIDANPNDVYVHYDEQLDAAEINALLKGDFSAFHESMFERVCNTEDYPEHWDHWNGEFAREFGYDAWDDMPESVQEFARENRATDDAEMIRDLIRNTRTPHVVATIHKPGAKEPENLIYAPDMSGSDWSAWDHKAARYIIDAFGVTLPDREGSKVERLADALEVVYGGYDREHLVLIGTVDLKAIYESGEAPTHVTIGPEDKANILFYEFFNGCGNMGTLHLTRTRTMPASFMLDGSYGYGVDSCYGFVGEVWRHEIRAQWPKAREAA